MDQISPVAKASRVFSKKRSWNPSRRDFRTKKSSAQKSDIAEVSGAMTGATSTPKTEKQRPVTPALVASDDLLASDQSDASGLVEATLRAEETVRKVSENSELASDSSDEELKEDEYPAQESLSVQNVGGDEDLSQKSVGECSSSSIKLGSEPAESSVNSLLNRAMTDTLDQCTMYWWQRLEIPVNVRDTSLFRGRKRKAVVSIAPVSKRSRQLDHCSLMMRKQR